MVSLLAITMSAYGVDAKIQADAGAAESKKTKTTNKKQARATQVKKDTTPVAVATKQTSKVAEQEDKNIKLPANAYLLDTVEAVVFGQEGTKIITRAELERPSLDGRFRTLDDLVYENLMILDAQRFKMVLDEDMIDKHLAAVQRENNLKPDDLKNIFNAAGYTQEDGRRQFGVISIINQLLDFKIRSRLIVPEKEVVAYYNANPEMQDASYYIQRAFIPFAYDRSTQEQQAEIQRFLDDNIGLVEIDWQEPFWIEEAELAQSMKFITTMEVGCIGELKETEEGFELFKLVEKKPARALSLEERYRTIAELLRRPRYEQLLTEYKKQLMDGASVTYLTAQ